jgi:hypothetical protein
VEIIQLGEMLSHIHVLLGRWGKMKGERWNVSEEKCEKNDDLMDEGELLKKVKNILSQRVMLKNQTPIELLEKHSLNQLPSSQFYLTSFPSAFITSPVNKISYHVPDTSSFSQTSSSFALNIPQYKEGNSSIPPVSFSFTSSSPFKIPRFKPSFIDQSSFLQDNMLGVIDPETSSFSSNHPIEEPKSNDTNGVIIDPVFVQDEQKNLTSADFFDGNCLTKPNTPSVNKGILSPSPLSNCSPHFTQLSSPVDPSPVVKQIPFPRTNLHKKIPLKVIEYSHKSEMQKNPNSYSFLHLKKKKV